MPESVVAALAEQNVELDPADAPRLQRFIELLLDANQRFNLTAITDPAEAWVKHIQDSLSLVPFIASAGAHAVLDVGSGGGLPGIPLAIALPEARVTLLESTGKKAQFLREAAHALELRSVTVVNQRAETAARDAAMREAFDAVVSRAVGPLATLLELTVPFARVGGNVLAIKGERAPAEVTQAKRALHALHAHCVDQVRTPTGTVVVVQKMRTSPHAYPRQPGEAKRNPL